MAFLSRIILGCILLISTAVAIPIHGPHQHGTLAVALVKEGNFLKFRMVVPAHDLLGFESAPKTPAQKKKLNDQYAKLYKEQGLANLFKFTPANTCWAYDAGMDSEILDYYEYERANAANTNNAPSVGDAKGHSDFELIYTFECDDIEILQITFHDVFPSIKKVDFYGQGVFTGKVLRSVPADEAYLSGNVLK